ncbi:MAG: VOC family protein [Chloroflexota bacterium]
MHRSRLSTILIDCSYDTMNASVHFWGHALGVSPTHSGNASDSYVALEGGSSHLSLELQQVYAPSRIHLNIETDNIEAEVARLEQLGATRVKQVETWWVMRDPSGHLFHVVPVQSDDFAATAQQWS